MQINEEVERVAAIEALGKRIARWTEHGELFTTAMLSDQLDAATAAFQVGYESPSQFSREYNRLLGAPPLRDVANLRQMGTGTVQ